MAPLPKISQYVMGKTIDCRLWKEENVSEHVTLQFIEYLMPYKDS